MSIALGPVALSTEHALFLLAFFIALIVGWLVGRQQGVKVEPTLTHMLIGAIISARLAFVLLYLEEFSANPIGAIDIRDGGFIYEVGLLVAAAIAALKAWRSKPLRGPLGSALLGGTITWGLTAGLAFMIAATQPNLPAIVLTALNGDDVPLSEFEGQPMVVNLWATWCPPCRREMPVLAEAQKRQDQIAFLLVNQGEHTEQIQRYLAEEGLEMDNVLVDSRSKMLRMMGANGMPSTYFFDASGNLADTHFGELSAASLKHKLKSIQPSTSKSDL